MPEVCTCFNCRSQKWIIAKWEIKCAFCGKTYKFSEDVPAGALVNITNDNF